MKFEHLTMMWGLVQLLYISTLIWSLWPKLHYKEEGSKILKCPNTSASFYMNLFTI